MPDHQLTADIPLQTREAALVPTSLNDAANTIEVVWTTGFRRRAYSWARDEVFEEELDVSPGAVDMTRFEAGTVQVVDNHNTYSGVSAILGIALRGQITKGEGRATLALSKDPAKAGVVGDIKAGIIRAMSFGYSVQKYEVTPAKDRKDGGSLALYRAVRWTPMELTFLAVGADPNASPRAGEATHTRSQPVQVLPCEFTSSKGSTTMETDVQTRDQQVADMRVMAKRHGMPDSFINSSIERNFTPDQMRAAILEDLARRDELSGGSRLNLTPHYQDRGEGAQARELMSEALAARAGGPPMRSDNPYRHVRVSDMARDTLEARGIRTTGMSPMQLIERGLHSTSDFTELLTGTGQRVLSTAYMSYQGGLKRVCKPSTARDFRAKQRLRLGEAPTLLKVTEHGEFKHGTMAEAKESYSLATYGRIFGITRQALVNDDLDAFGDMALRLGRAAAEFEAKFLVTLLTSNPTMEDTVALFHADHGNLGTGGGSALSTTALTAARAAMRLQKGLDSVTPIDATPTYLIVPAALETAAEMLIANITPAESGKVNPFSGKLELVVDPRLDAVSATAWYLAASPGTIDTIEYSYLESANGPEVFTKEGFEVDGVQMKVRLDFGAGVQDWRGLYRANGA